MVTYRLKDLQQATAAIHKAETALSKKNNAKAKQLVSEARALLVKLPITEAQAGDAEFNKILKKAEKKQKI